MTFRTLAAAALTVALVGATGATAQADTYVPGQDNQDFATSAGGWTATESAAGACVPLLLCPVVTDGHVGSDGADGNGYIRTQFTSVASTLLSTVSGTWSSPAFVYRGDGGKAPDEVRLDLAVRPALGALLGLDLVNTSSYGVDLVDQATGEVVTAVPSTPLTQSTGWTAVSAPVSPAALHVGSTYRIRITTSYTSVLTVVASGEVGYDDVRLTATAKGDGSGGGDGGGGGDNGGSGITSEQQLRGLATSVVLPGSATLRGDKVKLRVKCPPKASPKACRVKAQGLKAGKGSGAATSTGKAKVKAGKAKLVTVKVKPAQLARYRSAKKVFVKATVRVGGVAVTVRKKVRLKH